MQYYIAHGSMQLSKEFLEVHLCWSAVKFRECLKVGGGKKGGHMRTKQGLWRGFSFSYNICSSKAAE